MPPYAARNWPRKAADRTPRRPAQAAWRYARNYAYRAICRVLWFIVLVNSTKLTVVKGMSVAPTMSECALRWIPVKERILGRKASRVWNFCGDLAVKIEAR